MEVIDGRQTEQVSHIDRHVITGQVIVNGRLVTEFRAHDDIPSGFIVCEPVTAGVPHDCSTDKLTPEQMKTIEFETDSQHDYVLSESVTRFGRLFWDRGVFTART